MTASSIIQVVRQEPGQLARRFGSSLCALSAVPEGLAGVAYLLIGLLADPRLSDACRRNNAWLGVLPEVGSHWGCAPTPSLSCRAVAPPSPRECVLPAALLGIVREAGK